MEWFNKVKKNKVTKHYRSLAFEQVDEQEQARVVEEANRHVRMVPSFRNV